MTTQTIPVNMDLVDRKLVGRYLEENGLKKGGNLQAKVERLLQFYVQERPDNLCDCDCGGISDADLTECPFCGDKSDVDEEATATPQETSSQESAPDTPQEDDSPDAEETSQETGIVPTEAAGEVLTVDHLDREIEVVKRAAQDAANQVWEMGGALGRIRELGLWKLRVGDDGSPLYRNFKQFVGREFGINWAYAFEVMKLAANFTEEQVREIGASKLTLVLRAPKDRQQEMEDAAKKGASRAQMRQKINDLKGGKKQIEGKVTVALVDVSQFIPALRRPTRDGKDPLPARNLKDEPWCQVKMGNDVVQDIRLIRNADGELGFKVEFRRLKAGE